MPMNNSIWQRCPKTSFCGKDRIVFAVAESVTVFNCGTRARATMIRASGIGANSLLAFRKADCVRLSSTSQKISQKYTAWCLNKKRIEREQRNNANEHYDSAAFDSQDAKFGIKRKSNHENIKALCCKQKSKHYLSKENNFQKLEKVEAIEKRFNI